ncbi:hypothetical protein [Nitrolancea hollandica]|uniref:Uncharacterized protein n=1 Tax=Nitrolancea hollandica Lb TaxID=1129897 RepID=I4EFL1_9BACT|nr:hypothetical protein [Nitrolancea hollandica]CCF83473.1 hypothetical protein NITHO_2310016 [Nitrolancea hollandica Lb]
MLNESKLVVRLVSGESEWTGIYVNGELFMDSSSIYPNTVIDALKAAGVDAEDITVTDEWMEDVGRLPKQFSDIPEEVKVE